MSRFFNLSLGGRETDWGNERHVSICSPGTRAFFQDCWAAEMSLKKNTKPNPHFLPKSLNSCWMILWQRKKSRSRFLLNIKYHCYYGHTDQTWNPVFTIESRFEAFQTLGTGEIKVWGSLGSRNAQKHLTKKFHMWSKLLTGDSWSGVFREFGWLCCCVSPQSQDHFLELFSRTDFLFV